MSSITDRVPLPWKRGGNEPPPQSDGPPPGEDETEDPEFFLEMSLAEHLEELRVRIIYATVSILIAFVFAAAFLADVVLEQVSIQANIANNEIPTLSPTEGFVTWFKVVLYISIALSMPVLVYQVIRYIAPGLTRREKRAVYLSLPIVSILFLGGMAFAFFLAIPRALEFLSTFKSDLFLWSPRASELVTFYLRLMIGMGIAFELPAFMFILGKLGVINHGTLSRGRKIAFILVLAAAAIITPTPDPVNMMIVALPIYVLYELGLIFVRFT